MAELVGCLVLLAAAAEDRLCPGSAMVEKMH